MRFSSMKNLLAICLVAALITFLLPQAFGDLGARTPDDETYRRLRILTEVMDEIKRKYVEKKPADELIIEAVKGMAASLDPHSAYMTPEEYRDLQIETRGEFSGVGIEITMRDGVLTVVSPIEDTPADKAGVHAGDLIIKINGKLTKGMSLMDAVKAIRGPKGSKVVLTMMRKGLGELKDITIVRDTIPLRSVRFHILEDGYGYVRISHFQEQTTRDLINALQTMQSQKVKLKGLVLDLRNDPGGLLQESVSVADQFLNSGVVVTTKGRNSRQDMAFNATSHTTAENYPIICLVNQGSASASEIVAGALQDHKRAVIMGTQTFGKGSVQTIIPLRGNGALRLTTARYYTPNGRAIQAKGIVPDLVVPFEKPPKKQAKKTNDQSIRERDLKGAMAPEGQDKSPKDKPSKDNKLYIPKERLERDNQLRRALELLKAWQVFAPAAKQAAAKK